VAEVDGRVVGFLLGAVSKHFELLLMRSGLQTAAKMLFRLAVGRYARHPRSGRYIRWLLTAGLRDSARFPGVWHLPAEVYERRLRQAGVRQCYGAFFSYDKRRPESVYARYGFSVYDQTTPS
jgi:hypothetical protein